MRSDNGMSKVMPACAIASRAATTAICEKRSSVASSRSSKCLSGSKFLISATTFWVSSPASP